MFETGASYETITSVPAVIEEGMVNKTLEPETVSEVGVTGAPPTKTVNLLGAGNGAP